MDDVVSTFPLFRLPKKAMLNILRIMNLLQMFGISILSNNCKNLVESLKLTPRYSRIQVDSFFAVSLGVTNYSPLVFQLYQVSGNEPVQELGTPASAHIFLDQWIPDQEFVTWTNPISVKQLLDHLQFVFHTSGAFLFFHANCERFSLESIHKNVKQHTKSICVETRNQEHIRRVLSLFQPASLTLSEQALVNFRVPRDILVRNFDILRANNVQMAFDDFLLSNVRFITSHCRTLSMKILNKFLKVWIKSSNPRLECLNLEFRGNVQLDELFNGLKYQNAPNGIRRFKTAGVEKLAEVAGGHDIWRFDGTKATISVIELGDLVRFGFYVWHDHCVVI